MFTHTRRVLVATAATALMAALTACGGVTTDGSDEGGASESDGDGFVAMLLPEKQTPRWATVDGPAFEKAMAEIAPGVEVKTYNADGDPGTQLDQAQTALTDGASVLVVVAVDQFQAAQIVNEAHAEDVKVISYDHFIREADLDYYVAVDGEEVGRLQGEWLAENTKKGDSIAVINGSTDDENAHLFHDGYMSVLQPLFDSGERTLAGESWTQGWVPAEAQKSMEQILTKTSDDVQGVLSANDGMAAAIIQALDAQGLAGKIPVTGLDGTLASDQLILRGQQSMTVWRSLNEQARIAAEIAAALINDEEPDESLFTGTKNNDKVDVPWATVEAQVIDASNMQLLIDDGAVSKDELCEGIDPGTGPC